MSSLSGRRCGGFDLEVADLLHPANAFEHPSDVVDDADLTLNEKRAILAAWASDACALEAAPGLRRAPPGKPPVSVDDILAALQDLDRAAATRQPRIPLVLGRRARRHRRGGGGGTRLSA